MLELIVEREVSERQKREKRGMRQGMKKGTTLVTSSGEAQRENEVLLRKLWVDGWASSQGLGG